MFRKLLSIISFLLISFVAFSQTDSLSSAPHKRLRVSLLTCAPGDRIWETFGHTGVRVVDSDKGIDIVYNYGTFDGFDKNFEIKFMRGKVPYYLSIQTFPEFMEEYVQAKRGVEEQVFMVSDEQKDEIWRFLDSNAQPDARVYKYDFFFDNCATRIRDIFPKVLGPGFQYGKTAADSNQITFRDIINRYLYKQHWERFGINIILASKIDRAMTTKDIMFLPDFLRDGIGGCKLNGEKISTETTIVLPNKDTHDAGMNTPVLAMWLVALLTGIGLYMGNALGNIMSFLVLFISGALGCIILIMWFGTDHQTCADNYNLLWALPTNLVIAFLPKRNRSRYALIAILCIIISILLHVFGVQKLPLIQIGPFLLALIFVHGAMYRRSKKALT